jgi:hypothetical protein
VFPLAAGTAWIASATDARRASGSPRVMLDALATLVAFGVVLAVIAGLL